MQQKALAKCNRTTGSAAAHEIHTPVTGTNLFCIPCSAPRESYQRLAQSCFRSAPSFPGDSKAQLLARPIPPLPKLRTSEGCGCAMTSSRCKLIVPKGPSTQNPWTLRASLQRLEAQTGAPRNPKPKAQRGQGGAIRASNVDPGRCSQCLFGFGRYQGAFLGI